MALTEELKEVYTNYADTRMHYDAISLYHPAFKVYDTTMLPSETSYPSDTSYPEEFNVTLNSHHLIRSNVDAFLEVDGETVLFKAYPFNIVPPEQGSDQQDVQVVLDNVAREIIQAIEDASHYPEIPIVLTYRVYIDGSVLEQITPIRLTLTNITVNTSTIQATATRSDLYNRRFPYGQNSHYDNKFVGLYL